MKPGDLRRFEVDDEHLGADMFSGKLALLLGREGDRWVPEEPYWGVVIGDWRCHLSEGMLERWSSPVQTDG